MRSVFSGPKKSCYRSSVTSLQWSRLCPRCPVLCSPWSLDSRCPAKVSTRLGAEAVGLQPYPSSQNLSMASRQARHRSCILLVIQALNASLAESLLCGRKTRALVASSILEGPRENPIAA